MGSDMVDLSGACRSIIDGRIAALVSDKPVRLPLLIFVGTHNVLAIVDARRPGSATPRRWDVQARVAALVPEESVVVLARPHVVLPDDVSLAVDSSSLGRVSAIGIGKGGVPSTTPQEAVRRTVVHEIRADNVSLLVDAVRLGGSFRERRRIVERAPPTALPQEPATGVKSGIGGPADDPSPVLDARRLGRGHDGSPDPRIVQGSVVACP